MRHAGNSVNFGVFTGQQRCSIVVVTAAGGGADPGCGAGRRGAHGACGNGGGEPPAHRAAVLGSPLRDTGLTSAVVLVGDPARARWPAGGRQRLGRVMDLLPFDSGSVAGDLLVSTVPAGAADFYAERSQRPRPGPSAALDVVYAPWPRPSITPEASVARSRPGLYDHDGALLLSRQQRCSIVAVTAAGRNAIPGCGAGARDSRGMRESGGGDWPWGAGMVWAEARIGRISCATSPYQGSNRSR